MRRGAQVLQLEDVRGQLVGDGEARGISGGQRKRVNLGVELVAEPALLLLGAPPHAPCGGPAMLPVSLQIDRISGRPQ